MAVATGTFVTVLNAVACAGVRTIWAALAVKTGACASHHEMGGMGVPARQSRGEVG